MNTAGFMDEGDHRCGIVAVVGRPNVGKSTLINAYLRTKVSIVTPKPQTTRERILGILSRPGFQVLFQDTPGIHVPHRALNRRMVAEADGALQDADVVLALSDAHDAASCLEVECEVLKRLESAQKPVLVAINKVDQVQKARLLPLIEIWHRHLHPAAIVPISARTGDGLEDLLAEVVARLPSGPALYPAEDLSDRPLRFLAAEVIREKVMLFTHQEVPYSTAVRIEAFQEPPAGARRGLVRISATILVERPSQKKIVVGSGGAMIRRIGSAAREELEALIGHKVFLELFVKVEEDWTQSEQGLRRAGG